MQEDNGSTVPSEESTVSTNNASSQSRQRKKRKWDQPAESLVAACTAAPGFFPFGNMASLGGISVPGLAAGSAPHLVNHLSGRCASIPQVPLAPTLTQSTAGPVPKLKIQEELIAREIVINDAESSVRYKLTKRQTQEEIQKCTSAVVITRGKFRPPNAPPDGEKPLYLHISAGAHLKEMAEKILAVDRAAVMVEEILKQGQSSQSASSSSLALGDGIKVGQALSVCVFLGFTVDPSFNIAARIRGPNDQYINHIMNETGVSVSLRGCDSGNIEGAHGEGGQQLLHLFLSSNNPRKLEDAQRLAENLMDTISIECGALRVSSCKVYSAVPPPQQVYGAVPIPQTVYTAVLPPQHLLDGVHMSGSQLNTVSASGLISSVVGPTLAPPVSSVIPGVNPVLSHGPIPHGGLLNFQPNQTNVVNYPQPVLSVGTSYNGYGGIYPQATPLQQVSLALRQSSSTITSVVSPTTSAPSMPKSSASPHAAEKKPPQRRKFQELPAGLKDPEKIHQDSEVSKLRNVSTMPAPKKTVQSSNVMPPPPPRIMPPPPPKFTSPPPKFRAQEKKTLSKAPKLDTIPDTLVKLMEYGDEDDDQEEAEEEPLPRNSNKGSSQKPFWAL